MSTPQITQLDNGLRVVSETRANLETVSVGIWVGAGSRHEPVALNGITHCLEHMLFKGTKKRSAHDIALEIERVGGHLNAYTSRDNTTYYARVMKEDLPLALDLLSDILLNSIFDEHELERERDVIIQEIGQSIDTPDDIIFDYLQEAAFKGQALGRNILGTVETVKHFSAQDLAHYLKENYVADRIVISAVGNLSHEVLVTQVAGLFGGINTGVVPKIEPAFYVGDQIVEKRDLEQAHVTLGWPGVSFHDDNYYAMQVYSMILGGGMSSRLFQEVREKRGLAYAVYSFCSSHEETGLLGLYAGTSPEMTGDLLAVIRQEINKLADSVTDDELKTAIAQLKAGLMMALEATTSRMEQLGRHILMFDRVISVTETLEKIDCVTIHDVGKIADKIARENRVSTAIIGDKTSIIPNY